MTAEPLSLDEAIRTAITYEVKVRNLYKEAEEKATEEVGRRIFAKLAEEEQGHIDFLRARLDEWKADGRVQKMELATVLPSRERMEEGVAKLTKSMEPRDWSVELELLQNALEVESETGQFYKRMVNELPAEGASLFRPFLDIEDLHYDLVQSQLDALQSSGFWFDSMEFRLEAG
jgi:rubrerythrin